MHIPSAFQTSQPAQDFGPGRHVLLAIRDYRARYDLAEALLDAGCRLTLAASYNLADTLLDTACRYDLLISDAALPGLGGRGLARLAAAACPDMPVLLLDDGTAGAGVVDQAMRMMARWPVSAH